MPPLINTIRIKSEDIDKYMYMFTGTPKPWASYGADRIEVVLRHYKVITNDHYYRTFDTDTEEAVFAAAPSLIGILEATEPADVDFEVIVEDEYGNQLALPAALPKSSQPE